MIQKIARSRRVLGIAAVIVLSPATNVDAVGDRDPVPDWTLRGADGTALNFYQHSEGRPAVILFWATWCPYCRQLMPHLEKLRREFGEAGVEFYALNIWEDGDPVAHMKEHGYGFHLLLEADEVARAYGVKGTPGLIVVDEERAVVYTCKSGTAPGRVESELRSMLGATKPRGSRAEPHPG